MNSNVSSLLKKAFLFAGTLSLGWAAQAQTAGSKDLRSDTTHRPGMHRVWGGRNGSDREAFGRGRGNFGRDRENFRHNNFDQGREGWAGRNPGVRYTPEQRRQVMAINKEYRQRSEDLFKKDNSTLKEYKAGLIALQDEKKTKLEALLTQKQKDERVARTKRRSENAQVMAAARMERLKLRLNLTDDQVAKIKAGQENLHNQAIAIHENNNLLPQQKMEQMKALMAQHKDMVKSILTPEQQSQFEKMSHRRPGGFGGPGFPRRPGRGGEDRHPGAGNGSEESK
jgi:hypothetical protein